MRSARVDLLVASADAGECDLVAKGRIAEHEVGLLYLGEGRFQPDRRSLPAIPDRDLRRLVTASAFELTYTCVPPGSGRRIGEVSRDQSCAPRRQRRSSRPPPLTIFV